MNRYLVYFFTYFFSFSVLAVDLLIKIPTRTRPSQFFRMLDLYYEYLSGEVSCAFLITCDHDDITMNNELVKKLLNNNKKYPNLFYYYGNSKTKVQAYNEDINKHLDFKVILVASDDMEPKIRGYDKIIMKYMKESFPTYDGVLNFHDGHVGYELNTMPVIGINFYKRFGYIYYPEYVAFACDDELTQVSRLLHKERICNEVIIEHKHPAWGTAPVDALYTNNNKFFARDVRLYKERAARGFDLHLKGPIKRKIYYEELFNL